MTTEDIVLVDLQSQLKRMVGVDDCRQQAAVQISRSSTKWEKVNTPGSSPYGVNRLLQIAQIHSSLSLLNSNDSRVQSDGIVTSRTVERRDRVWP